MTFLQILPSPEMIIALFCYKLSLAPKQSLTFPWFRQNGQKQSSKTLSNNSQWGTQPNLPPLLSAHFML